MSDTPAERRSRLVEVYREASICERCPLAATRNTVVFGNGDANADLMFIGEAPGAEEDRQGLPFVGRAGALLTELLAGIELTRDDVFVANVLKCLSYRAMVQLGDGSWERIGRLVRSRYSGEVMSVNSEGELVRRRVVGWHATPLADRSVFRLTYRSGKRAGPYKVAVDLTGDHPVLTERGYVDVEALEPSDRVATGQGLSKLAHDVVCGSLLGDAGINGASAYVYFDHSQKQFDYALFKANLLAELSPRSVELEVAAVSGGPRSYPVVQVRTLAHRALGILREQFYRPSKTIPEWIADSLNPRMLAIWFLDDGYTRIRETRRPLAEIATVGFGATDLQVLLKGLDRLGLAAKASRGRLYFDVPNTEKLSALIAPYVPSSMRYKLHPEVESRVPFDGTRFQRGQPIVMFDQVEVEDITSRPRGDTTFFCIDVEETHNFVTSGGVVHNCRPPGNRDPQPEEIESCRPYLERQVELIEPKVIGTLGNFATKLLTGNPTGITRVRGTPQIHELGGRTVYVMPLLHPAAALRTPSLVETLRGDFAGLRELIATELPGGEGDREAVAAGAAAEADQLDLFA